METHTNATPVLAQSDATRMRAMVYRQYGSPDMLHLEQLARPTLRAGDVLVKVVAAAAAAGDWHLLRAEPFLVRMMAGFFKPKYPILGGDMAGRVEAVGAQVSMFKPGDAVYADLSNYGFGAFAEYVAVPERALAPKPARLTFEQAAAMPVSAVTALQALRDHARLQPGQHVLINGASGGVGTFAIQIAKAFGAEVTAVCSTSKVELVRSLGADHVIDYTREDFTSTGKRYDVILAVNGYHPLAAYQRALQPQGVYIMVGGTNAQMVEAMLQGPLRSKKGGQRLSNVLAKSTRQDLLALNELIDAGKLTPVIDRQYPLEQLPEAMRYLEAGHARGKIVIMVE